MKNQILNFLHEIPIEVFHENDSVSVEVYINDDLVHQTEYEANIVHSDLISFYHDYNDAEKSCINIKFSGNSEAREKYLKIKSIFINSIRINVNNANYRPKLNPEWWTSLNDQQKETYLEIIYGTNGNKFGWFGEISFDFATGFDKRSSYKLENNIDKIISKKLDWIFLDNHDSDQWSRKSNDKLL